MLLLALLSTRETGVERGLIDACDVLRPTPGILSQNALQDGFFAFGGHFVSIILC